MNLLPNRLLKKEGRTHLSKVANDRIFYAEFSSNGELSYANEKLSHCLGNKLETITHQNLISDEVIHNEIWNSLENGKSISTNFVIPVEGVDLELVANYSPLMEQDKLVSAIMMATNKADEIREDVQLAKATKSAIDLNFIYILFTPEGYILDANHRFISSMSYDSLAEIKDKHHRIFAEETYANSAEYKRFWEDLAKGDSKIGQFHRLKKTGQEVWLEGAYTPLKDKNGNVMSVVKIANDITEKKLASKSVKELRDTIDLSFGMIQFDPHGYIQDVNGNFHRLMGYEKAEDVIGKHHSIFASSAVASSQEYLDFWANLRKGITQSGEFERMTKNNESVWIQAAYTPLKKEDGSVYSVMKIAVDITENKKSAMRAKSDLKDEVLLNLTEISTSIGQIAVGARNQAEKIDQASVRVESALQAANSVAGKAQEITNAAKQAAGESETGQNTVDELASTVDILNEVSGSTQASMNKLAESVNSISAVLNVIKEVSNQTNLLALNASIEAAQAGDQGKGFAVIAQEIRQLAESTRSSTGEIEKLIETVQSGSKEVAEALSKVTQTVKEGMGATTNVKETFKAIAQSTGETFDHSNTIFSDANSQSDKMKAIVQDIEDTVVISEQSASASEEVSNAVQILENRIKNF